MAPWAYSIYPPEPYAAAAPLGPAARSRVRGADSLAQALDLLANPHRIVDDRRLAALVGDQTGVWLLYTVRRDLRLYGAGVVYCIRRDLARCRSDCVFRCQLVFAHVPVTVIQEH